MKVALVTGAGSGMGEATARQLVKQEDCAVVITGRREEPLRALEAELGKDRVEVVALDITTDEAPKRLVQAAMDRFGQLDYLVNNAGIGKPTPVHETTDEIFDEFINILLRAPFRLCREALEVMQDGASIVNVASTFAIVGGMRGGPYSAAKGGIVALSKHMAAQYGPRGIRTNVMAPGVIETPMTVATRQDPTRLESFMTRIPMGRVGQTEDLVGPTIFLASDMSRYVTGITLAVDGGFLAV